MIRGSNTRRLLMTLMASAAGTLPLSAQTGHTSAVTLHAEVGKLESVVSTDANAYEITTSIPAQSHTGVSVNRTYETNYTTLVEGLGSVMDVGEIPQSANGSIVVVDFVEGDQGPLAKRIHFTGDREILATRGTIKSIDREDHVLVLQDPRGEEKQMRLDFGYGATIDSKQGLLAPSDLKAGQEATVYYSEPTTPELFPEEPDIGIARLVFRTG